MIIRKWTLLNKIKKNILLNKDYGEIGKSKNLEIMAHFYVALVSQNQILWEVMLGLMAWMQFFVIQIIGINKTYNI